MTKHNQKRKKIIAVQLVLIFFPLLLAAQSKQSTGLKDYYHDYFPIGAAVSTQSLTGKDSVLIIKEFNTITPENAMKWGAIHPAESFYNWKDADAIVAFAERHGIKVRGHNLLWHEYNPSWLFKDAAGRLVTKEVLLKRLKDHITAVVGRYKGRVYAWDVVNEAVDDKGPKILRDSSLWHQVCGDEYIARAFQYAHEADPDAVLVYNDYNTERPEKRERIYKLLKQLVDKKVPVHAVGLQAHWSVYEPSEQELTTAIRRYSSLGLKIQFTEVDISIYPWEKTRRAKQPGDTLSFTRAVEEKQLEKYNMVFKVFRENRKVITGITFWNIAENNTWLEGYPVQGRKNYPLLFDKDYQRKQAYQAVINF